MSFIDEVEIYAKSGDGGPGVINFRREKFVPMGGPDGGNGGNGGSVIIVATNSKNTLLDFRYKPKWLAENGHQGQGSRKDGRHGKSITIEVPVGTQVINTETGELICDLSQDQESFTLLQGGKGGKGNTFFKSATHRAPEKAQPGIPGTEGNFKLSLKLLADVGIIGFPNAGKSTLISKISAAKPKIASYPFTTIIPNLGVVALNKDQRIVVADIPGLIPGAHQGKGLGISFLKHIERSKIILHLIDPFYCSDDGEKVSITDQYHQIRKELELFSEELKNKPEILVINKCDSLDEEELSVLRAEAMKINPKVMFISAVSGFGIPELLIALGDLIFKSE
jgi:GTP-binding protein